MSDIVASGKAISKSPINTSKSKMMMYSTSKSVRFPKFDRGDYADQVYILPDIKSKRYTTFGLGNKSDFTKGEKGVNTQFYSNGTDFDKDHKYKTFYYETNKMLDKNVPGPGGYNYLKPFGRDAPKFSMKGRSFEGKPSKTKDMSPGPGDYANVYSINRVNSYNKMSISFKVHYKKDKKRVKAFKTFEDFIQKASKKFKTQFDCEHYTFQFENDDFKMETVSNEKEYQEYLNSFELNEGDKYELEAKIKEKKETTKSKEEESNNQNEEDKDVQEGKDIMQMLTQITQFLSVLDYRISRIEKSITEKVLDNRISPIEKSIQTLTEKVDRFIENKEQKPKAPKASVTLSKCSIEPITIKGKETKEQEPPVFAFTLLDVEPKEIDMIEIKMRQQITLKLKSNCNTMLVGNKWKLKGIFLKDSLLTFDDVYLPEDIKPQSTFELSIRLNPIKMDVLNSITEKQIEFVAQIKNDITKVCSDNLNILINFRNNDIIRLNTFQNRIKMFQGGNQNQSNQNIQPIMQNVQPPVQNVQFPVQNVQPPVQNIQPIIQNVQPPVQYVQPPVKNVQPPNNKLEPKQRPPEQEKTSANNLSKEEINKIMTELNEEYYAIEKLDESDIKDAIIQYNGNKEAIINYLYSL